MEGNTTANSAIFHTPHGTSEHTQHSATTLSPHGISPFPNPTVVETRNPTLLAVMVDITKLKLSINNLKSFKNKFRYRVRQKNYEYDVPF